MRRFAAVASAYAAVLVLAFVLTAPRVGPPASGADPASQPPSPADDITLVSALEPFDSCEELLGYFREEALERVGPWGLDGGFDHYVAMEGTELRAGGPTSVADTAAAASSGGGAATGDFSTTNVQEAGVDEPDIAKTDGRRVVALARGRLHVLTVDDGGTLTKGGSVKVIDAWGGGLLLDGDRVLVMGQADGGVHPLHDVAVDRAIMPVGSGRSSLQLVDISEPSDPRIVSTLEVDGQYSSARLVDGVARVVLTSQPMALPFVTPEGGGIRAEREARSRNRQVVRDSTIDQWLPYAVATDEATGNQREQTLLDCEQVHHPDTFSGFGLVSIVTVDLRGQLHADGTAAVVGSAETTYASTDNLYVALNEWGRHDTPSPVSAEGMRTTIHQFDISDVGGARYIASGQVDGRLLNQWALSEHDGHLRVATTTDRVRGGRDRSDSAVTVLRAEAGRLVRVGHVDGLGRGEQIYAVRYAGDIGYVVTFRQIDPLYTLDLSDPENPRVRGELKIPGYSAYLHPVGEGRLLGVGQDASADGQVRGGQVSLFDVADLTEPRRVDQLDLGPGAATVEHDHRAFLHWPATGTVVLPFERWERRPFMGAVVLHVDGDRIREVGEIEHAPGGGARYDMGAMVQRAFVMGDALVTVSDAGVAVNALAGLAQRQWVPFSG